MDSHYHLIGFDPKTQTKIVAEGIETTKGVAESGKSPSAA